MAEVAWKAMELTWHQCTTSEHYCFICSEPFDPRKAKLCSQCNWLVCPSCGGCYCELSEEAKRSVDEFYRAYCIGRGCPYGKAVIPIERRPKPEAIEARLLERRLNEIRQEVMQIMEKEKEKVPSYIVDHGARHGDRVAQNIESLERLFEEISMTKAEIRRFLNQEEIFTMKVAAYIHDIGRFSIIGGEGSHALQSAQFVEEYERLNEEQRREVASMCVLHSDGATREVYGTSDLNELVKRGLLSPERAYKGTLMRIADALDAGKKRAERNTAGRLKDEVVRDLPARARSILSHWRGHMGFEQPKVKTGDGRMSVEIPFDSKVLQAHGSDVAFRVKDLLRDIRTTLVRRNCVLNLKSDDLNGLQQWFQRHRSILREDIEGMEVNIGG